MARFWVGPDEPPPGDPGAARAAALATLACPDQGGAELPARGGITVDPPRVPPGFTLPADPVARAVVSAALSQVGKPYVWGGKGPDAFDCSGLTQAAWAHAGVTDLGRHPQPDPRRHARSPTSPPSHPATCCSSPARSGRRAVPRHVGIYVGNGLVVDARSAARGVIISSVLDWRTEVVAVRHIADPGRPGPPPP